MEIYSIEIKNYKRIYASTVICCFLIMMASYLLVKNGFLLPQFYNKGKRLFWLVFIVTMVIAQLFSKKQRIELEKLNEILDFDKKIEQYQKIYRLRMIWYASSFLIYSILFVLTGTFYYFYFNFINFFMIVIAFPNLKMFKLELKNEEIFFV